MSQSVKIKKLRYKIAGAYPGGWKYVDGYAIDSGLPVRICVHKESNGLWGADHYDTGLRFGYRSETRTEAIEYGIRQMMDAISSGRYFKALDEKGYL